MIDPTNIRLSKHFLLSDFMGNHSVYTRGYPNVFPSQRDYRYAKCRDNGTALCNAALEPIIERHGALSIGYGYISPEVSREIVTYMDPDKPSHHRWDLGAAADICVHGWVNSDPDNDDRETAPIMLAHDISGQQIPYSRMITYSESPYICIAVSEEERRQGKPRGAFYENRYTGRPNVKPQYTQLPTPTARYNHFERIRPIPMEHGWRGAGYPTYHGGGRRQMQHVRVSRYTMLSDWVFDLQSIAHGAKNIPNLKHARLWETICAVGDAYDEIIEKAEVARMSIIAGFVSHANPYFDPSNDWRTGVARFRLVPPEGTSCNDVRIALLFGNESKITGFGNSDDYLEITVEL
jgi:hypothetical protein